MLKHQDIIEKMTVEEKAAFLSGQSEWTSREIGRLDIPSVFFSDGPHGLRKQAGEGDHLGLNPSLPATCFPTAATVANSWDTELGEEIGNALGEEAQALGVDVVLGPGLNIKRSPLCGRNFEYFSEDPYLVGKMAAAYIRGIQKNGVYACPKHFAVNNQETRRMAMNAVVDERTLRELYLTGFEIAVKEGRAKAIMTSYNEVNGTYANENEHLLKEILREEWNFDGIVVTDWGGSNDHVKGVAAGSDLEMPAPGLESARELLGALKNGQLTMEQLDHRVDTLLDAVLDLSRNRKERREIEKERHHALARKAAAESMVLLKNGEPGFPVLPLKENCRVALIGDFAETPRYQGAGSSLINPLQLETIKEAVNEYPLEVVGYARGYHRNGEGSESLRNEALELAKSAEVILYCFGLSEGSETEGLDRSHMRIPDNQIQLLEELKRVNPNIVGILSGGSAIEMPWENCCRAILHGYLGGQAGAGAVLDILTGKINPSGKLNETYPLHYEDTPAFYHFPGNQRNAEYRESLFVGYRYYDTNQIKVRYPFGYGLSYTYFAYSELHILTEGITFTICNTGKYDGAEAAQLYVCGPQGKLFRPSKELKGFIKVYLKAGEKRTVKIPFDDKTFRYWNHITNQWEIEGGEYRILVGSSSMDIRLEGTLMKEGTNAPFPYEKEQMRHYFQGDVQQIPDAEFQALLGHPIPRNEWKGELGINDAVCQMYYAKSRIARLVYKKLTKMKKQKEMEQKPDLNLLFIYNIPFRGIAKMTEGRVSMGMVNGIVEMVNGHFFRGLKKVIGGYVINRSENRKYERLLSGKEQIWRD